MSKETAILIHHTRFKRDRNEATIPANLGIEKRTNPFLRWDALELQISTQSANAIQTFARLRGMKDHF